MRLHDETSVLLKTAENDQQADPDFRDSVRQEFLLTRSLESAGIARALDFVDSAAGAGLVLEDRGDVPLTLVAEAAGLGPLTSLRIAIGMASALSSLHQTGRVHRAIQPANVLVDLSTLQVRLCGLALSSLVPSERPTGRYIRVADAAYMAPEQSGRLNRSVDSRADLYSLGAVLYMMLTGRPPFSEATVQELIHANVAITPPAPADLVHDIPVVLSAIVMKLLAKAAEDRYQSARGLRYDLDRCLDALERGGDVTAFPLGSHDAPSRFELSEALVGRDAELADLRREFDAVQHEARARLVFVSGGAGVGKTHLVEQLRKDVLAAGGLFAGGRFTESGGNRPHEGLVDAVRALIRRVLAESPDAVDAYRHAIVERAGEDLHALSALAPELSLVIGPLPAVDDDRTARRGSLARAVAALLSQFATQHRPVLLFLDDFHWADASTLDLVAAVLSEAPSHLLIVATLDSLRAAQDRALMQRLERVGVAGIPVHRIALENLSAADTLQLVAHHLHLDEIDAAPLGRLVFARSNGSPLVVKTCLQLLDLEGALNFDGSGGWVWTRSDKPSTGLEADVLDTLLSPLSAAQRTVVSALAVVGHDVALDTAAAAAGLAVADTEACLIELSRRGLVRVRERRFACAHDTIRDRARATVTEEDGARIHLRAAQALAGDLDRDPSGLFDALEHFARADALLSCEDDRRGVAALCLEAARRTKASAVFTATLRHSLAGIALLPRDPWSSSAYPLALALHLEAAESARLTGHFTEADRLVDEVRTYAKTIVDAAPALETRLATDSARGRRAEGLVLAIVALRELGLELPAETRTRTIRDIVRDACDALDPVLARDSADRIRMTGPARIAAMRLAGHAIVAAWGDPTLQVRLGAAMIALTAADGYTGESVLAYVGLGGFRTRWLGDFDGGRRTAEAGLALLGHPGTQRWAGFARVWAAAGALGWHLSHRELTQLLEESYRISSHAGEPSAFLSAITRVTVGLHGGVELAQLDVWIRRYESAAKAAGHEHAASELARLAHVVHGLQGSAVDLAPVTGGDVAQRQLDLCTQLMAAFLSGHDQQAAALVLGALDLITTPTAGYVPLDFWACICLSSDTSAEHHAGARLAVVDAGLEQMRRRASYCPRAYGHKIDLVDAERLRVLGSTAAAGVLYDRAFAGAVEEHYTHEAALAAELAARMHRRLGRERQAAAWSRHAVDQYRRWGAHAKVSALEDTYGTRLQHHGVEASADVAPARAAFTVAELDLQSLQQAVGALSNDLAREPLLRGLLSMLVQYSAAQRGYLFRMRDGAPFVEASLTVDSDAPVAAGAALDEIEAVSHAIIRYVLRTREPVVLANAAADDRFANDTYVRQASPRSILCTPVLHRGMVEAVLYLEHRDVAAAFQPERLAAVQLVSAGAISALLNARLVEDLTHEVGTRREAEAELRRALEQVEALKSRLEAENVVLREEISAADRFEELIGRSAALQAVIRRVKQVAGTAATVLIEGETGTGKELVARAIHRLSPRKDAAFVKVNCAALPATLIESELFGHERGAFTGAVAKKLGRFELADRGTLFLDEVGDLPLDLQAKLLRVLQEGEFERVGSERTSRVDVRVIAATNRRLEQDMRAGRFRDDLYYRLNVFPIVVPPLRDRADDIPLLVWYFIVKHQGRLGKQIERVPRSVMERLSRGGWPGNVRELEHVVQRALIMAHGVTLTIDDLPVTPVLSTTAAAAADVPYATADPATPNLVEIQRRHILQVLDECQWRLKGPQNAAARLGINPSTLRSRMKKLGIERPRAS